MKSNAIALKYEIRAQAGEEQAEAMLYGEIIENTREGYKWAQEDQSASDFDRAIKKARSGGAKKLLLRINSPGGIVSEAVAMRSALAAAGFDEITIRIEGMCASAATIPATLPGARVEIAEGSKYMIHNPSLIAWGDAKDLEHDAKVLRGIEDDVAGFYVEKSGQAEEMIRQWMDEETWFKAEDAVKYGFADEVIRAAPRQNEPEALMSCARMMYRHMPEMARTEEVSDGEDPAENIIDETEREEEQMDMKELTMEQLETGAPELYASICAKGAQMERERLSEIDELTPPGYEELAAQAKESGESAYAYHKRVIKAQKEKAAEYLKARAKETEPALKVPGSASDQVETEEAAMKAYAKEMAELAMNAGPNNGMY